MERFVSKAFLATIILSVHATSSENAEFAPLSAAISATSAVVAPQLVSTQSSGDQEDLTSLHLSSAMSANPPLVADLAEHPEYTFQLIQVGWRKGDPIDLYVIKPKGVPNPPVVL